MNKQASTVSKRTQFEIIFIAQSDRRFELGTSSFQIDARSLKPISIRILLKMWLEELNPDSNKQYLDLP